MPLPKGNHPSGAGHTTVCIGIDPGQSGGLARIDRSGAQVLRMPETEKDIYDSILGLVELSEERRIGPVRAVIEQVHSFPGMGVVGCFKFGMGYGGLRMALTAASIPFEEVRPEVWQRALGIPPRNKRSESKPDYKRRLYRRAQQLFSDLEFKKDQADALLIAEYCRRKFTVGFPEP